MKNAGLTWTLVAAAGVLVGVIIPATAADLGGNCCADLEERIAELEATTARKGNLKVSLEISGHVNETLIFWDDGSESNAGVYTNDNSRTRFRFNGKAKIDSDWEAGYKLELGVRSANSKRFDQNDDRGDADPANVGLDIRDSYWFLKSKSVGALSVGLQSSATDAVTEINLTQTRDFSKYSDVEDSGLGLRLRDGSGALSGLSWRRLIGDSGDQPGEGEKRFRQVKYETPAFQGFSASAAWGEDDFWDVALRYAGDFAGFKVAAGIGYLQITDGPETLTECNARGGGILGRDEKCSQFGGSISIVHEATGLFVNFGAGEKSDDVINETALYLGLGVEDRQTFWAIQAGIEKKFNDLGKTTIYGEYYDYNGAPIARRLGDGDEFEAIAGLGARPAVFDTGVQVWGVGIAQGIDNAATTLYLSYRHVEGDLTLAAVSAGVADPTTTAAIDLEDLDIVLAGAIVKF